MNYDIVEFIRLTEIEGFDPNKKVMSCFYPISSLSLVELCCYYGSVACFKFLITKFKLEITEECIQCAFLGRNPDIVSECLKEVSDTYFFMHLAIASHNIDFVTYMMNELDIEFNSLSLIESGKLHNLHAFLVYYDQTKDIDECMAASSLFDIPSLCEYFISKGADINARCYSFTALHLAAKKDCSKAANFLISKGANMELKYYDRNTALDLAAQNNSVETLRILLLHGANMNSKADGGRSALHHAASFNNKEAIDILISFGADVNAKDDYGTTPQLY